MDAVISKDHGPSPVQRTWVWRFMSLLFDYLTTWNRSAEMYSEDISTANTLDLQQGLEHIVDPSMMTMETAWGVYNRGIRVFAEHVQ